MIVMSSRTLAVVFVLVVLVSLAGSMLGYALGTLRPRTDVIPEMSPEMVVPAVSRAPEPGAISAEPPGASAVLTDRETVVSGQSVSPVNGPTADLAVGQAACRNGVTLTLEEAAENPWEQGLELRFTLANTSGKDLRFLLVPERALAVEDSRGAHFHLRWAEYIGEVEVPSGQQVRLVHALFEGQVHHPGVNRVTVLAKDVPGLGEASWSIPLVPPDQGTSATPPRE